jgi:hypothetical protein
MKLYRNWREFWVLGLCLIWLWIIPHSSYGQSIYSDGSTPDSMIQYSAWAWSTRSGMRVSYAGRSAAACVPGAILVRLAGPGEWPYTDPKIRAAASDCGGGFLIRYPTAPDLQAILHETGHTLFAYWSLFNPSHLSDAGALMYSDPSVPTITQQDVLRGSPRWPVPDTASLCHVELMPDYALMIPDIAGYRVVMRYLGAMEWAVESATANTGGVQCDNALTGNVADLPDVRGPTERYRAVLEESGGVWRLVMAVPI